MDDFLVFASDRQTLKAELCWIKDFLADRLRLTLHPRQQLNRSAVGAPFLGFRVFPGVIRLTPRSRACFARKLQRYEKEAEHGLLSESALTRRVSALVSFTLAAEAAGFRRLVLRRSEGYSGELSGIGCLIPDRVPGVPGHPQGVCATGARTA